MTRRSLRLMSMPLAAAVALFVAPAAWAGWRTEEPSCAPSKQPGTPRTYALSGLPRESGETNWVEPWANWWSACVTASAEPAPALCRDGAEERATDRDGGCLSFVCRGGSYDIRSCADPLSHTALPRITALRLFPDGYAALVEHKKGSKEDTLSATEIPLTFALRALQTGARLPDADLRRVPEAFWKRQRAISVVERAQYTAGGLVAIGANGGR